MCEVFLGEIKIGWTIFFRHNGILTHQKFRNCRQQKLNKTDN